MRLETAMVLLLALSSVVAIAARATKVPYAVALVIVGLALGSTGVVDPPPLTKELLYNVFLPGLIFESAFHLNARSLWSNKIVVVGLAIPGVVIATFATARVLGDMPMTGLTASAALVFGALISATDPIAVVALFKTLGAPNRLAVVMEGESLINDGTAVVLFSIAVSLAGGRLSLASAALDFARVMGASVIVGAVIGLVVSLVIRRIDDALVEITLTAVAAYGSFFVAEQLHLSGILATLAAGMVCGSWGAPKMCAQTRTTVEAFWGYVAFALNSIVFLLVGFEVRVGSLVASWRAIVVAFVVVVAVRALLVVGTIAATRTSKESLPWRWAPILAWGGLRGALSMVLAVALPHDFPGRHEIVAITFGVVALSLVLQGLSAAPLIRALRLGSTREATSPVAE